MKQMGPLRGRCTKPNLTTESETTRLREGILHQESTDGIGVVSLTTDSSGSGITDHW